jgi:putative thioredoxin
MSDTPHVVEVTAANFMQTVVQESAQRPVMVDFWASWCQPCKMLLPIVTRLAAEYGGAFVLAKVNIDEQPELAQRFGVRSVPTVRIMRNGQVVDEFMGALPEGEIRRYLDRHVERESDRQLAAILAAFEQGEQQPALAALAQLQQQDPANDRIVIARIDCLITAGAATEAVALIEALPIDRQADEAIKSRLARAQLASAVADAPSRSELESRLHANARDSAARYQLAMLLVAKGEFEPGLQHLLQLLRSDRNYQDGAARKAMLMVFEQLGSDHPLTQNYRRSLANALH